MARPRIFLLCPVQMNADKQYILARHAWAAQHGHRLLTVVRASYVLEQHVAEFY